MTKTLQPGEKLIAAGYAMLRTLDGTEIPAVPQFIIEQTSEAQPAENIIQIGAILPRTPEAEARYAAALKGRYTPASTISTPLYVKGSVDGDDCDAAIKMFFGLLRDRGGI